MASNYPYYRMKQRASRMNCLFQISQDAQVVAFFVIAQSPRAALNRYFALLALSLLGWVASLFAFDFTLSPHMLLWVGRFNFACIIVAVTLGFLFVREIRMQARPKQLLPGRRASPGFHRWLWAETAAATVLSFTPLVDAQELIEQGQHVTRYGPLFALYLIHILMLLGATLYLAFQSAPATPRETQSQLSLIGGGIVAMAAIALVTSVFLPYALMDFRFIHVGTLSTIFFLVAVGYAVFAHHLFSVRPVQRSSDRPGGVRVRWPDRAGAGTVSAGSDVPGPPAAGWGCRQPRLRGNSPRVGGQCLHPAIRAPMAEPSGRPCN